MDKKIKFEKHHQILYSIVKKKNGQKNEPQNIKDVKTKACLWHTTQFVSCKGK